MAASGSATRSSKHSPVLYPFEHISISPSEGVVPLVNFKIGIKLRLFSGHLESAHVRETTELANRLSN